MESGQAVAALQGPRHVAWRDWRVFRWSAGPGYMQRTGCRQRMRLAALVQCYCHSSKLGNSLDGASRVGDLTEVAQAASELDTGF